MSRKIENTMEVQARAIATAYSGKTFSDVTGGEAREFLAGMIERALRDAYLDGARAGLERAADKAENMALYAGPDIADAIRAIEPESLLRDGGRV